MDNQSTTPSASEDASHSETKANLDRAAELLARGLTPAQTAKELGVKPQTIRQWHVDYPSLRKAVNAMRAEMTEAAYNTLAAQSKDMAQVIHDAALGDEVSSVQLRAAEMALRLMMQFRDNDLETRVAALEAAKAEGGTVA